MRDFHSIVKELKKDFPHKAFDKDIAYALEITQANFATLKKRNSIPYKEILLYCKKNNLCSNEVFFD